MFFHTFLERKLELFYYHRNPIAYHVVQLCFYVLIGQVISPYVYTEMGTIPAYHYHKYCPNRKINWKTLFIIALTVPLRVFLQWEVEYIISSQETAFELKFLRKFDLLIGQVSYTQKADIYNYQNGYDSLLQLDSSNQERFAFHLSTI